MLCSNPVFDTLVPFMTTNIAAMLAMQPLFLGNSGPSISFELFQRSVPHETSCKLFRGFNAINRYIQV